MVDFKTKREFLNKYHENESAKATSFVNDNFPIGEFQVGEEVGIRFVPDEESNMFCWRILKFRDLPFDRYQQPNGEIVATSKSFRVRVPAFNLKGGNTSLGDLPSMYLYKSADDPIQVDLNGHYGTDEASRKFYKTYKANTNYLSYGFVVESATHPEWVGKLFKFSFGEMIQNRIENFYNDKDRDHDFFDLDYGCTFWLRKTKKGEYNNYDDSNFSSKATALPYELRETLREKTVSGEKKDLKSFLLKKPTQDESVLMLEMYKASSDGMPFKAEWAKTYKPFGFKVDDNGFLSSNDSQQSFALDISSSRVEIAQKVEDQKQTQSVEQVVQAVSSSAPQMDILSLLKKQQEESAPVVQSAPTVSLEQIATVKTESKPKQSEKAPSIPSNAMDLNALMKDLANMNLMKK